MFKSIESFSGRDNHPGVALEDIRPYSQRAHSLMIRNRTKPLLKQGFMNIAGAIEMLAGLEYHHDNIVRLSKNLAIGISTDETHLYHEAVAYVNRMGQLYYFAKSTFVVQAVAHPDRKLPTLEKYIVFRMKHAAHRSIDHPRDEPEDVQQLQAMSLSRTWGKLMTLKPGAPEPQWPRHMDAESEIAREFHRQQWQNRYLTFQIYDADHDRHLNLTIEIEHEPICAEIYALLSALILWEPNITPRSPVE